ncbi:hypothetical protein RN001_007150 [Aquatica leii]|uniref:Calcium uniporter protein n=1 Tax=Aquatica leii TaxID=1421715 RepID=A0AAN7PW17_9COLE|nr:hypothetical protein RN001_007150 [Aquatica leii]
MAVASIVCKSRLLFRYEVRKVFNYSTLANSCFINKCTHLRKFRQCRQFTVSIPLGDQSKEKHKDAPNEVSTSSSSSSDSDQTDQDEDDVVIEFCHGLPQVTVPLPSRKEKCKFTLRPISNTVGDFLEMLKKEDKGIDRAVIHSTDGTRIASSNTIETLLQDNFKLIVNDSNYNVKIPQHHRITSDELKAFDDVKTVISQLYETLHVEDFHVQKENDLTTQLEVLRLEIQPLEEQRLQIEMAAERKNNWLSWVGLGLMSIQFGILARLTWWEYSWDIMEPVTYFVTYGTAMAAYAYFVLTKEEYILQDVKNRQHLLTLHKKSKKLGLDLMKYNQLRDQISSLELELMKSKSKLRKNHINKKTSTEVDSKNNKSNN